MGIAIVSRTPDSYKDYPKAVCQFCRQKAFYKAIKGSCSAMLCSNHDDWDEGKKYLRGIN